MRRVFRRVLGACLGLSILASWGGSSGLRAGPVVPLRAESIVPRQPGPVVPPQRGPVVPQQPRAAVDLQGCGHVTYEDGRSLPDLRCIELFPVAELRDVRGFVELEPPPSLFGVAVSARGSIVYGLVAHIQGLPPPAELSRDSGHSTYVAWATTPVFEPVLKLGEVRNGTTRLSPVDLDQFFFLVSAEPSADVTERTGPLVLRGRSPSMLMEAHDMLTVAPEALRPPAPHGEHAEGDVWTMPPMHPDVPMMPGMAGMVPKVSPFLPDVEAAGGLAAIPKAEPRQVVRLGDGGTLDLEAGLVKRQLGGRTLVMYGFNGQYPGPLLHVTEESTIFVNFTNRTELPTSVHWHGVRLDNRFDGVPGVTQDPVLPGESFRYRVFFRDAGLYWYHPHHREDIQQELGLYGNMLVDSPDADYYGPANREAVLMLDDFLLGEEGLVPFGRESSNYMLMGRFGNVFLVNGEPAWETEVRRGEVVRFFLTNVSNTRTFNLSFVPRPVDETGDIDPLPVKVVGTDVGRFEREVWADSVVISPAERYIVEVRFPEAGEVALVNSVHGINHRYGVFLPEADELGVVRVADEPVPVVEDHAAAFETLRTHEDVMAEIDAYRRSGKLAGEPDLELVLTLETTEAMPELIERVMQFDRVYFNPVEWTDTMPMMNWVTTGEEVRWVLRDPATGAENMDISSWRFRVGDLVKIRLRNERNAFHAMQHPLHIHGQRFLVLERDGVPFDNLAWKDTVLLPVGTTTDILLELSNPGRWMVHCHIAEHLESGMKLVMEVEE